MCKIKQTKIAITGNICSGKSFIADCFIKLGIKILKSDKVVSDLYKYDHDFLNFMEEFYPQTIIKNTISKELVKKIFFSDDSESKDKIEQYIYSRVDNKRNEFINSNSTEKYLVFEVPLLFEKKLSEKFDFIILASANLDIRRERYLNNRKGKFEDFEKIRQLQIDDINKVDMVDMIIDTEQNGDKIMKILREKFYDRDNF